MSVAFQSRTETTGDSENLRLDHFLHYYSTKRVAIIIIKPHITTEHCVTTVTSSIVTLFYLC